MSSEVVVVGAGNLGRRHMQSLALCKQDIRVSVVEPLPAARDAAMGVAAEAGLAGRVNYYGTLNDLPSVPTIAIVATTAEGRLDILLNLLRAGVRYIVLEKVAFNSLDDISKATEAVSSSDSQVWVNCPRRLYPFYQELKGLIASHAINRFVVAGNRYGLACNGIHFVDLLAFLAGGSECRMDASRLDLIQESKRAGYVEFFGAMEGVLLPGSSFELRCSDNETAVSYQIEIDWGDGHVVIDELNGKANICLQGEQREIGFSMPYQSELTGPLIDSLLSQGLCGLTGFFESMRLHRSFIEAAYPAYARIHGDNERKCVPVT